MIRFAILGPRVHPYPARSPLADEWVPGPMPRPRVYLLQRQPSGDAIVYGYAADGRFSGDNWFESPEVAREVLRDRHGTLLSDWRESGTGDIDEAMEIALTAAAEPNQSIPTGRSP